MTAEKLQQASVCTSRPALKVWSEGRFRGSAAPLGASLGALLPGSEETHGCLSAACGGELNAPSGSISSPNYPNLYPHSRVCRWELRVQAGRRLTLTINDLRLEGSGNTCAFDYVDVSRLLWHECSFYWLEVVWVEGTFSEERR